MLVFTLKMIIADIQKTFRGLWIIIYFILFGIIAVMPFFEEDFYVLYYLVIILFSTLVPQITKVFYVLPLGRGLLRRYLHLRTIILSSFFILVGSIMTILSLMWPVPNLERGWLMVTSYIMMCIVLSLIVVTESLKKINHENSKKPTIAFVFAMIMLFISIISALFFINFKIQLIINIILLIISEAMLIIRGRYIYLKDYVEPMYRGLYTKAWRDQQKKQYAEVKRGMR